MIWSKTIEKREQIVTVYPEYRHKRHSRVEDSQDELLKNNRLSQNKNYSLD